VPQRDSLSPRDTPYHLLTTSTAQVDSLGAMRVSRWDCRGATEGGDIGAIVDQLANADRMGYAGVWSTEVARDPFLPALLAAEHTPRLTVGTAIAVAFARNPMSMATVANDLQSLSSGKLMLGLGLQIKGAHRTPIQHAVEPSRRPDA